MNFHHLLQQRDALLRQTRLANIAYAYARLGFYADRIARSRLRGPVAVRPGDSSSEQPWPGLVALEGSQAVLEEHFLEEEMVELADIMAFLGEDLPAEGLTLRLEELAARFFPRLRQELAAAGIAFEGGPARSENSGSARPNGLMAPPPPVSGCDGRQGGHEP